MADYLRRRRRLRNVIHIERPLVDRGDPLANINDDEIRQRYRFNRQSIFFIVDAVDTVIQNPTRRGVVLPTLLQVLITLRYLATGTFQIVVADLLQVHQTTVCRVIHRVCRALAQHLGRFVRFPLGPESRRTQAAFRAIAGRSTFFLSIPNELISKSRGH